MATNAVEISKSPILAADVEKVLIGGDLAKLSPEQRVSYYNAVCHSLGLNPLTKPFAYISLNGKLVLYALKDCTEQLRTIHAISLTLPSREVIDGVYVVTASASRPDGRKDEATGAVPIDNLKGESKANAMMKAETKAKRRVTLSICGLGMLDESEASSIEGARIIEPEDVQRNTPEQQKELAERRIKEPSAEAPLIPKPLEVIVRNMEQGKAGAVRAAFDFLKAYLVQVSPERGLIEYQRIREKHQLAAGTTVKQCIPALIEMYETGEFLREAQIENTAKPEVTDADLPSDLFGENN